MPFEPKTLDMPAMPDDILGTMLTPFAPNEPRLPHPNLLRAHFGLPLVDEVGPATIDKPRTPTTADLISLVLGLSSDPMSAEQRVMELGINAMPLPLAESVAFAAKPLIKGIGEAVPGIAKRLGQVQLGLAEDLGMAPTRPAVAMARKKKPPIEPVPEEPVGPIADTIPPVSVEEPAHPLNDRFTALAQQMLSEGKTPEEIANIFLSSIKGKAVRGPLSRQEQQAALQSDLGKVAIGPEPPVTGGPPEQLLRQTPSGRGGSLPPNIPPTTTGAADEGPSINELSRSIKTVSETIRAGNPLPSNIFDLYNAIGRSVLLTFDVGSGTIQGQLPLFNHPREWAEGVKSGFQSMRDPDNFYKTLAGFEKRRPGILGRAREDGVVLVSENPTAAELRMPALMAEKLYEKPIAGGIARAGSRASQAFGDFFSASTDTYRLSQYDLLTALDPNNKELGKWAAKVANNLSLTTNLDTMTLKAAGKEIPIGKGIKFISPLLLAARFYVAPIELFLRAVNPTKGSLKGTAKELLTFNWPWKRGKPTSSVPTDVARASFIKYLTYVTAITTATNEASGNKTDWDPRSNNWGDIKNTPLGDANLFGPLKWLVRFMGTVADEGVVAAGEYAANTRGSPVVSFATEFPAWTAKEKTIGGVSTGKEAWQKGDYATALWEFASGRFRPIAVGEVGRGLARAERYGSVGEAVIRASKGEATETDWKVLQESARGFGSAGVGFAGIKQSLPSQEDERNQYLKEHLGEFKNVRRPSDDVIDDSELTGRQRDKLNEIIKARPSEKRVDINLQEQFDKRKKWVEEQEPELENLWAKKPSKYKDVRDFTEQVIRPYYREVATLSDLRRSDLDFQRRISAMKTDTAQKDYATYHEKIREMTGGVTLQRLNDDQWDELEGMLGQMPEESQKYILASTGRYDTKLLAERRDDFKQLQEYPLLSGSYIGANYLNVRGVIQKSKYPHLDSLGGDQKRLTEAKLNSEVRAARESLRARYPRVKEIAVKWYGVVDTSSSGGSRGYGILGR